MDVELQGYPPTGNPGYSTTGYRNYGYSDAGERPPSAHVQIDPEEEDHYANTDRAERRDSVASSASYVPSDDEQLDEVQQREMLAAHLEDPNYFVDMLPSRTLGRGIISSTSGAQSLRRRGQGRQGPPPTQEDDIVNLIVEKTKDDSNAKRATIRRQKTIRELSSNMETKRAVRNKVAKKSKKPKKTGPLKAAWYSISYSMVSLKEQFLEFMRGFGLWKSSIKRIEGNYGSSVTSFFELLRWLLYINILVFLLTFCLIVIPDLVYRHTVGTPPEREEFAALDLITGGGWMTNSSMFYGSYSNEINKYNIPMAYLLVYSICYILILIILIQSITKSYRQYFVTGDKAHGFYSSKAFTGWDFMVTSEETAQLKHRSIYLELAENLSSKVRKDDRSWVHDFGLFFLRLFTNLVVLLIIAAACYLIIWMYNNIITDLTTVIEQLAVPLVVAGYNLILPYLFTGIARLEKYKNPKTALYISLFRVFVMKVVVLITLIVFWLRQVDSCTTASCECWETLAGQEIYKLVIIDFIVQFLATAIVELIFGIGRRFVCKALKPPEFNIARNTMDLIQSQAYTWIGMYFSPLLMVLCIVKIILTFYVKKISVIYNCKPSSQVWRAAFAKTVFLIVLFVFFAICGFTIGYILVQLPPSDTCGPFLGAESPFDILLDRLDSLGWFKVVLDILTSPGFILAIIVLLVLGIYYFRTITKGRRKIIKRLKQQITLEGQDKRFLLKRLGDVVGQVTTASSDQSSTGQPNHGANHEPQASEPQGRPDHQYQPRRQRGGSSGMEYHTNYPGVMQLSPGADIVFHQ